MLAAALLFIHTRRAPLRRLVICQMKRVSDRLPGYFRRVFILRGVLNEMCRIVDVWRALWSIHGFVWGSYTKLVKWRYIYMEYVPRLTNWQDLLASCIKEKRIKFRLIMVQSSDGIDLTLCPSHWYRLFLQMVVIFHNWMKNIFAHSRISIFLSLH